MKSRISLGSFRSREARFGVSAENLNLLRVSDDVSRGKGVFPKADCASIENKRGDGGTNRGGWGKGRITHVFTIFLVHLERADHAIGTVVTSELRHEYGRPHVGGFVVGSPFLCRAPFLGHIGCSTNFYNRGATTPPL